MGDEATSRSPRHSIRFSSRYTTDSDLDTESPSSRYTSKYKSLLSGGNDDYPYSRLSRYSSRDESENATSSAARISRFSSNEGDDDLPVSTSSARRQMRLSSYYEDDNAGDRQDRSLSYTRRFTSDSFKDNLEDYKVTTPTEESESRYSSSYQSGSFRTLSRLDSKDAVSNNSLIPFTIICYLLRLLFLPKISQNNSIYSIFWIMYILYILVEYV